jgi:hypothetical protein
LTIYFRLPGFLNQTQIWAKGERSRTFYNTDGLINCLRQPGQPHYQHPKSMVLNLLQLIRYCVTRTVPAAETESIGLPAYAQLAAFFAHHLDYFILTQNSHPLPGLGTVNTIYRDPKLIATFTGIGKKLANACRWRQLN